MVTFTGTGSDPEDGSLTGASLVWTSSLDGQIGTGGTFATSALSTGTHTITLTATDSRGGTGTASLTVTVLGQSPSASITAPADGSSVNEGAAVTFTGTGSDPQDGALTGASLVWTSSLDGQIGTGGTFMTSALSAGTHTVTLTATDADGNTGAASITLTVVNQAPSASITAPADSSTFGVGAAVTFTGTGSDPEDGALTGAALVWTSSVDGQIGTGVTFMTSALSVGTHTITLTATDANAQTGTASITLTVVNQAPSASITAPADGSVVTQGDVVTFAGTGSDPEDGALTGASLVWTSSLDGQIGTGVTFMTTLLSVGTHTVTLTATDSQGQAGTASLQITVNPQAARLTVTPGFAALDVGGMTTLSVAAFDATGAPITSPPLTVVSRNGAVASAPSTAVTGVATGVTDVVVTSGMGADSARIAVVAATGFAALLSTALDDAVIQAAPGATVTLQLRMIRPPAGSGDLGSIQGNLQWDPAQLTFQSSAVVETGWSWFPNEANVGTGRLDFSAFSPTGTAATLSVAQVVFTVAGGSGGGSALNLAITVAGDAAGADISASVQSVASSVEIQ